MSRAPGFLARVPFALAAFLLLHPPASEAQTAVAEIRSNPDRWINRQVTVVGRITAAAPNPAGTTRGFYTLLDDTDPVGLIVRSRDLPAVGREFVVTGTWILDPGTGDPVLDESSRRDAGGRRAPIVAGGGGGGGPPAAGLLPPLLVVLAVLAGMAVVGGALLLRRRPAPVGGAAAGGVGTAPAAGPAVERVDLALEVRSPDGARRAARYRSAPISIGRSSASDLRLDDPEASRRHAEIVVERGRLVLVDLGSTHGTRVDGARADRAEIRAGSEIEIGSTRIRVL